MKIENNLEGVKPTAKFIASQHTGKFVKILPETYLIKGAKNDRGFDQAFALTNNRKDLVLIDVVEEASREAVETLINDGYKIKGIFISGQSVLNDAYADLGTISEDAGGADIYIHPDIAPEDGFETKALTIRDSLMSNFNIETEELPGKSGEVLIYSSKNDGMLFAGDSAQGSEFDSDSFIFTREIHKKQKEEFAISEFWQNLRPDFTYFFPRRGKPAIEIDSRTRSNISNWLSRGSS